MDDFDVEVTDLRTGAHHPATLPGAEPDAGAAPARRVRRSPSQRQRVGALLAGLAVLVTLAVLLVSSPNSRETLDAVLRIPTPTATAPLSPGDQMVMLTETVPWVTIRLDGKTALDHNFMGTYSIVLTRGRHTLDVHQPPFAEIHCAISAPASRTDTCPLSSGTSISRAPLGTRTLDFGASFTKLSDDQRASLISAIRAVVTAPRASVPVRPGERYVDATGATVTTGEALTATIMLDIDMSGKNVASLGGTPCLPICDMSEYSGYVGPPDGTWHLSAAVQGHWRYTRADGTVVVDSAPVAPGDRRFTAAREGLLYQVKVTWDGTWRVTPSFIASGGGMYGADLICRIAAQLVDAEGSSQPRPLTLNVTTAPTTTVPDEACLVAAQKINPNSTQGPSPRPAYFLYRFGVLLAANDEARKLLPNLPLADDYERTLATKLARQMPY